MHIYGTKTFKVILTYISKKKAFILFSFYANLKERKEPF